MAVCPVISFACFELNSISTVANVAPVLCCSNPCAERVHETFWEVVQYMHVIGLLIHVCVLDGGSENRKFIKMNVATTTDDKPLQDR